MLTLQTSFTTYLLEDVYHVDSSEVAKIAGNLGFFSDIGVLFTELTMGTAMDLFGRKGITVVGIILAGISLVCMPLPNALFGLYCIRLVSNMGIVPALYSPFSVDFIRKDSLGLAAGYSTVVANLAGVIATAGAIQA